MSKLGIQNTASSEVWWHFYSAYTTLLSVAVSSGLIGFLNFLIYKSLTVTSSLL